MNRKLVFRIRESAGYHWQIREIGAVGQRDGLHSEISFSSSTVRRYERAVVRLTPLEVGDIAARVSF